MRELTGRTFCPPHESMVQVYWLEQAQVDVPAGEAWLGRVEEECLGRMRFAKRRTDWRLGRWTAKRAVSAFLNLPCDLRSLCAVEIMPEASGAPRVSIAGQLAPASISLSHRSGVACCAVAPPGVSPGCDLEFIEARSDAFLADYFTPEERRLVLAHASPEERCRVAALLWSAKESALKALGTGLRLDTRSVAVEPQEANGTREWSPLCVRCDTGRDFQGWWRAAGSFVRTLVAEPPPLPPIPLRLPA